MPSPLISSTPKDSRLLEELGRRLDWPSALKWLGIDCTDYDSPLAKSALLPTATSPASLGVLPFKGRLVRLSNTDNLQPANPQSQQDISLALRRLHKESCYNAREVVAALRRTPPGVHCLFAGQNPAEAQRGRSAIQLSVESLIRGPADCDVKFSLFDNFLYARVSLDADEYLLGLAWCKSSVSDQVVHYAKFRFRYNQKRTRVMLIENFSFNGKSEWQER